MLMISLHFIISRIYPIVFISTLSFLTFDFLFAIYQLFKISPFNSNK